MEKCSANKHFHDHSVDWEKHITEPRRGKNPRYKYANSAVKVIPLSPQEQPSQFQ